MHIFYWGLGGYFKAPVLLKILNVGYETVSKSPTKHMRNVSGKAKKKTNGPKMINKILISAFLICGLVIATPCYCQSLEKESKLSNLNLEILRKGQYSIENIKFLTIDLKITNLNADTVKFWIFNCGYLSNVLLKSIYYEIIPPTCSGSYPELISLKNNQSIYLPIIIKSKAINYKITEKEILGFVIVFEDQYSFGDPSGYRDNLTDLSLRLRNKEEQMIWTKNSISDSTSWPFQIDN